MSKKVAVIMGFDSDLGTTRPCIQRLKSFGVSTEVHIISTHYTSAAAERFAPQARGNDFGVIIAAAGKTAHLAGALAAYTTLFVAGVPIKISVVGGLDSLLSMAQILEGIPAAHVVVGDVDNAAIPTAQMLAPFDEALSNWPVQFRVSMAAEVGVKDHKIQMEGF